MILSVVTGLTALFYTLASSSFVMLSWEDKVNPIGTRWVVYRAEGVCSVSTVFKERIRSVSVRTFTDLDVKTGSYCYAVAAVSELEESNLSTSVGISVTLPNILTPPSLITVTVK